MDVFGATYYITSPSQFWSELESVIYPDGRDVDNEWEDDGARKLSLDEIDEKVRTFVVFAGEWLDDFLSLDSDLDNCVESLLSSPMFSGHDDRMLNLVMSWLVSGGLVPSIKRGDSDSSDDESVESTNGKTAWGVNDKSNDPAVLLILVTILLHRVRSHPNTLREKRMKGVVVRESSEDGDVGEQVEDELAVMRKLAQIIEEARFSGEALVNESHSHDDVHSPTSPSTLHHRHHVEHVSHRHPHHHSHKSPPSKSLSFSDRSSSTSSHSHASSHPHNHRSHRRKDSIGESVGLRRKGSSKRGKARRLARERALARLVHRTSTLLYEVCRIVKLETAELELFTESFINRMFDLVEFTRTGEDEAFNYSLIKLIIALNEQFMVGSLSQTPALQGAGAPHGKHKRQGSGSGESNLVMRILRSKQGATKTFGENVIFILNRAESGSPEDLCVSLLILKILYLLFTTSGMHEYFYTNDLCVLVDVFIRELGDLPDESEGLRHTYLRVLHPLLTQTQLKERPYKRHEIRRVLSSLIANSNIRAINPTTKRLVERNLKEAWCSTLEGEGDEQDGWRGKSRNGKEKESRPGSALSVSSTTSAPHRAISPRIASGSLPIAVMALRNEDGTGSTLSVNSVAAASEPHPPYHGPRRGSSSSSSSSLTLSSAPQPIVSLQSLPELSAAFQRSRKYTDEDEDEREDDNGNDDDWEPRMKETTDRMSQSLTLNPNRQVDLIRDTRSAPSTPPPRTLDEPDLPKPSSPPPNRTPTPNSLTGKARRPPPAPPSRKTKPSAINTVTSGSFVRVSSSPPPRTSSTSSTSSTSPSSPHHNHHHHHHHPKHRGYPNPVPSPHSSSQTTPKATHANTHGAQTFEADPDDPFGDGPGGTGSYAWDGNGDPVGRPQLAS